MSYTTLVVLAGVGLLGTCSGLVGCFAVLRRRALIGDALAHAALPGVCLAFLVLGYRSLPAMAVGGLLTGVVGIAIVSGLRHGTRVKEDAAIGIVLSVFYGAGVVLISWIQQRSVAGNKAGLDSYFLGRTSGILMDDVVLIGAVSLVCLMLIVLMYKEFKVVAFDPEFANVQGWPALRLDLLLMTLIAVTVIVGLPAVGVILMAALLIIPAAAARFWTDRLGGMLALAGAFGLIIGVIGALTTTRYALPSGPMIVLTGAALFLISMLMAPRRGLLARAIALRAFRRRTGQQKLLRLLYDLYEHGRHSGNTDVSLEKIARWRAWWPGELAGRVSELQSYGWVAKQNGRYSLTEAGLPHAARAARTQRLWELFLVEFPESAGPIAELDGNSIDDRLPRDVIEDLEQKLADQGRLPSPVDGTGHSQSYSLQ